MTCQGCPREVPILTERMVKITAQRIPLEMRRAVLEQCLTWLSTPHAGLTLYEGIRGRHYASQEKAAIARELVSVLECGCPFRGTDGCTVQSYLPNPNLVPVLPGDRKGWLPTLLARELDHRGLVHLIDQRVVADAKVAMLTRDVALPGQADTRLHTV